MNSIKNVVARRRGQEIIDRLVELGWQNVTADEDFFCGVTGTYANLQVDVVFDESADHFARVSIRAGDQIGRTVQSWTGGQVRGALAAGLLAAPTLDESKLGE